MTEYDLVIRRGQVIDGSGAAPMAADVAIRGNTIVDVGEIAARGREEIDARGCIVTPGFVDIHTHYDGQALWSERITPSSSHGVTTVIGGNCGVGFAPCRASDRTALVDLMEGVEDIPEIVMAEGLPWSWETFPQYLSALEQAQHDIDIGVYLPHSPLRIYAMGERAIAREAATDADIEYMKRLAGEALDAGALGFATSRIPFHRTAHGELIASYGAGWSELMGIGEAMRDRNSGVLQVAFHAYPNELEEDLERYARISRALHRPVMLNISKFKEHPECYGQAFEVLTEKNKSPGVQLKFQIFARPVGAILSHNLSNNPFRLCPSYLPLANLPLEEKLHYLKDPAFRARLISETPDLKRNPSYALARDFEQLFSLEEKPNYEPKPSDSVASRARAAGRLPEEVAYDLLMEDDGRAMLYAAIANYADGNLDFLEQYLPHPHSILALGDGGAHYGIICDSGYTTFLLTHWTRDRRGNRLSIPQAVHLLTQQTAQAVGLKDRGLLRPGYKADLNVIDYARLNLHRPVVVHDLPSGGRRLDQSADGYVATVVSGSVIARDGVPTGILPGKLVRGARPVPASV